MGILTAIFGQKAKPKKKAPRKINNAVWALSIRWAKAADCWVFNDERFGLVDEPFIGTTNGIIDWAIEKRHGAAGPKKAKTGYLLGVTLNFTFDKRPPAVFGKHIVTCRLVVTDGEWSEYKSEDGPEETGWLCPALFNYTDGAPETIYVWVS